MTRDTVLAGLTLALTMICAGSVAAQSRPAPVVEATAGWAGFLDDSVLEHRLVGVGARAYLWPRLSIGPELTDMAGPEATATCSSPAT